MSDLEAVLAALPQLSPDERAAVEARLKALRALSGGLPAPEAQDSASPAPTDDAVGEVAESIARVVLRKSGERVAAAGLRRVAGAGFREKAEGVVAFAGSHAPDRVRRRALLDLGVGLLYAAILEQGGSASSRTLMQQLHRLPAILDEAFPGYASAGLLRMVIGGGRKEA